MATEATIGSSFESVIITLICAGPTSSAAPGRCF